jgi:prepilin-type processing-associated H-X9-DG protein
VGDLKQIGKSAKTNRLIRFIYSQIVSLSQWANVTFWDGHPDISISEKLGYLQHMNRETKVLRMFRKSIDLLFKFLFNEDKHCQEALLGETFATGGTIDQELIAYKIQKLQRAYVREHEGKQ